VRLAAIIFMERTRIVMRWIFVIRARKLMMREAIKLVMLTILIMGVEIVVVGATMMRTGRVKALGLLFIVGILVPVVEIPMLAVRILLIIGT